MHAVAEQTSAVEVGDAVVGVAVVGDAVVGAATVGAAAVGAHSNQTSATEKVRAYRCHMVISTLCCTTAPIGMVSPRPTSFGSPSCRQTCQREANCELLIREGCAGSNARARGSGDSEFDARWKHLGPVDSHRHVDRNHR